MKEQTKPVKGSNEDLAIEVLARFTGNSRGTPIAKNSFIDGANWMRKRLAGYAAATPEKSEQLTPVDGWIDVKDGLPEKHEKVLVFFRDKIMLMGVKGANGWSVFWSDGVQRHNPERPITHWRPLPLPPGSTPTPLEAGKEAIDYKNDEGIHLKVGYWGKISEHELCLKILEINNGQGWITVSPDCSKAKQETPVKRDQPKFTIEEIKSCWARDRSFVGCEWLLDRLRELKPDTPAIDKSNEAIERTFSWNEMELMLSAFICEHAPRHSQFESPGTFINNFFTSQGGEKVK